MNNEAYEWMRLARKLRRLAGLSEPTPEEAAEAMRTAHDEPLSEDEVTRIVQGVRFKHGERKIRDEGERSFFAGFDTEEIAENTRLVMNRNLGDDDEDVNRELERLREEALTDDDEEDDEA